MLLAIGVLVAIVGTAWVWSESRDRIEQLRQELASRLGAGDEIAREARALAKQGQESIGDLQHRLARAEVQLAEAQGQQAAMEALYLAVSRNREDQVLAEIEQAVGMATQQLQLAGNVEAALVALQGAQARLAQVDAAPLIVLRKALARDIEQLLAAPRVDASQLSARFDLLLDAVDRLPLAFTAEAAVPAETTEPEAASDIGERLSRLGRELWSELKSLVRIERLDRPDPALLSPSQEVFLRENLRLRLLSARLSLLARNGHSYASDLKLASQWLERYFDPKSAEVRNLLDELRKLREVRLTPEGIAALHETHAALRTLQQRPAAALPAIETAPRPSPKPPASPAGAR